MKILWSDYERDVLAANYQLVGALGCSKLLPARTPLQCRTQASKRGISLPRPKTVRESFERKFYVTPGCWIWSAGCFSGGYGQFKFNKKASPASRVAYELYVGAIPQGLIVCHRCDTPACVNPDHLFLGTDKTNAEDRHAKGRSAKNYGMAQGTAKLTDAEVMQIRSLVGSQRSIAKQFNVSASLISRIKNGKSWPHLLSGGVNA